MIDLLLLAVIAAVTWCVASEGAWGSVLAFLCILLSGLLAMNFFEGVAEFLQGTVASSLEWSHRWDVIALLGLFAGLVFGLRTLTEQIMPTYVEVHPLAYNIIRWGFGFASGYVTAAILLTSLHVSPLPRDFWGFTPERNNLLDSMAPDRQWLAYTQHVSERVFRRGANGPVFDGDQFPRIPGRPDTVQTWSSFPMRYAMRRERYQSYSPVTTSAPPPPPSTAPRTPATQPSQEPSREQLERSF